MTHKLKSVGLPLILGHFNHGVRGTESERDQRFVEGLGRALKIPVLVGSMKTVPKPERSSDTASKVVPNNFERKARNERYRFLGRIGEVECGSRILVAHTADDQVETVLMRILEGAGIAGLKGIPRETGDGVVRPILDVWKEDILKYLEKNRIPYRVDRSNFDTRFERNWIRHVLIPLLVKRYGKQVKKRIFTLGERFRELDAYLEAEAANWVGANQKGAKRRASGDTVRARVPEVPGGGRYPSSVSFRRSAYSNQPTFLRIRILQKICFDRLGLSPNERLLRSMDRTIRQGGPSAQVAVGKGWKLRNRYGEASFARREGEGKEDRAGKAGPGESSALVLSVEPARYVTPTRAKREASSVAGEYFDGSALRRPLAVRPLRAGDRIRPFGLATEKKVKEILIDRKIPREERWGRPAVCDAAGEILWIPGVVRSAHAPVTKETKKAVLLRLVPPKKAPSGAPSGKSMSRKDAATRAYGTSPGRAGASPRKRPPSSASERGRAAGR